MYDPLTAFARAYRGAVERHSVQYDALTAFVLAYEWAILAHAA